MSKTENKMASKTGNEMVNEMRKAGKRKTKISLDGKTVLVTGVYESFSVN